VPELSGGAIVLVKVAAIGAVVTASLIWASMHGLRRLWAVALSSAALASLASIVVPDIELYSYYCGRLCGEGWDLSPFGIAVSVIVTGVVLSPVGIRKRRLIRVIVGWIVSIVFLVAGLSYWIS